MTPYFLIIRTQVFSGDFCESACFFVWASGAERLTSDSSIGVHRPRFKKEYFRGLSANEAGHKYLEMANVVRDYLEDMNIPNHVIENMFNQSSNNILYLNSSNLKKLRKVPFFDEWIIANCGAFTVEEEDKIYELWQKEFYEGNLLKEEKFYLSHLMSLTLADWFVIQVKVSSFFMITWITASRPNRLDGHG